jgi:hypothetical protein
MRTKTSKADKTRTKTTEPRRCASKTKRRAAPAAQVATGQSVVKQKYRERYEDGNCDDGLARKLRKYLKTDGGTVDLAKLQQLAERNGVWASRYAPLNPGLARMVVANRLRNLVRAGKTIDWG